MVHSPLRALGWKHSRGYSVFMLKEDGFKDLVLSYMFHVNQEKDLICFFSCLNVSWHGCLRSHDGEEMHQTFDLFCFFSV